MLKESGETDTKQNKQKTKGKKTTSGSKEKRRLKSMPTLSLKFCHLARNKPWILGIDHHKNKTNDDDVRFKLDQHP